MRIALLLCLLLAACKSDGGHAAADMFSPDLVFAPAPHEPPPQVPNLGGPVIANPHLVTITFPNFPFEDHVKALGDWLVTSSWFTTVGAEYGIGAGTHEHVLLTFDAPTSITYAGLDKFIADHVADGSLPKPSSGQEPYIYMLYVPPGTTISDSAPGFDCAPDYAPGFHYQTQGSTELVYAIVQTCVGLKTQQIEWTTAHELIEAASDPFPVTQPGYIFSYDDPWSQTGAEIADICNYAIERGGYLVTQVWSNQAAAAGQSPCIPSDTDPYFMVSPSPTTLSIPPGGSGMVTLTGWSIVKVADWSIGVSPGLYSNDYVAGVTYDPPARESAINNGDTVQMTISIRANAPSGAQETLLLYAIPNDGTTNNYVWPLVINIE